MVHETDFDWPFAGLDLWVHPVFFSLAADSLGDGVSFPSRLQPIVSYDTMGNTPRSDAHTHSPPFPVACFPPLAHSPAGSQYLCLLPFCCSLPCLVLTSLLLLTSQYLCLLPFCCSLPCLVLTSLLLLTSLLMLTSLSCAYFPSVAHFPSYAYFPVLCLLPFCCSLPCRAQVPLLLPQLFHFPLACFWCLTVCGCLLAKS